jgi:hypothetical protein
MFAYFATSESSEKDVQRWLLKKLSLRHLDIRREDEEQRSANRCDWIGREVAAVV